MQRRSLATIIFLFCSIYTFSQATVRGTVLDRGNGEPIIYGNVYLKGTTMGANTDVNGFYTLTNVPAGEYILMATYIGYDTVRAEIVVPERGILSKNLYMEENSVELGVVNISARKEQARTEVRISKLTVSPKEIKALPSTGGDADIVQYLQVLPGIISTGDQGGQLFIRGGSPVQNKIMLDGLTIYNPFHSIGFYSIFETELIKNVDVLTGGFNATHGGRISAVVDITTREGDKSRFGGQITGSPFMYKGMIEGPLIKFQEGKASASFVLTSKRSIIDQTSKQLYAYGNVSDSIGLPFKFNDNYGKLSVRSSNGSFLNLFGFNFSDEYNNPDVAKIGWDNFGGGANFKLIPGSSGFLVGGLVGISDYNVGIQEDDDDDRTSRIRELSAGIDFTFFGTNNEVKYGFEVKSIRTEFDFTNPFGLRLSQFQNTTELSGFLNYRQVIGGLVIEPGIRLQYYASLGTLSPEPRLGLKYNVNDKLRFKAAGGLYSQNVLSTSNERDVVNLFSGFLSGPESRVVGLDGEDLENKLQKAGHAILGVEYDLTPSIELNVEGYYKDFSQLVIVNRNKLNFSDANYSTEQGDAYGVDFSMRFQKDKLYVWSTYSLGFVNRFDGEQEYPTVFDRRHNVNFLATYNLDDRGDFQVSARWNLGSGFPFTKTQGFYNYNSFLDGVSTDYVTDNPEEVGILYSDERNGGRLPYYHRLDLSVTKIMRFSKHANLEIVASVSNVYNRKNIFYFDRVRYSRVDQLPIIPSVGVKFNF